MYKFGSTRAYKQAKTRLGCWQEADWIYIVWQGQNQVRAVKNLESYHYQLRSNQLRLDLSTLFSNNIVKPRIICIGPSGNHDNVNLFVKHLPPGQKIINADMMLTALGKAVNKSKDASQQREFANLGYTS